ncbi:hypothetical protein IscW_ISCW014352 [Ixodes scapularis]|uniref:Uncharacterized protein n=1 Tax=Ixodes scapularis TaxID=6945 RepID=B7QKN3_IXOSC|nr:hypothetical protein IscW_ISCW014352 [Ixodes scapularis]|eukprot:XP_002415738.1 hypothetical protein IscW_ISCW014352 [Ixodes scapularis]
MFGLKFVPPSRENPADVARPCGCTGVWSAACQFRIGPSARNQAIFQNKSPIIGTGCPHKALQPFYFSGANAGEEAGEEESTDHGWEAETRRSLKPRKHISQSPF